jgi:hypothetical protein
MSSEGLFPEFPHPQERARKIVRRRIRDLRMFFHLNLFRVRHMPENSAFDGGILVHPNGFTISGKSLPLEKRKNLLYQIHVLDEEGGDFFHSGADRERNLENPP